MKVHSKNRLAIPSQIATVPETFFDRKTTFLKYHNLTKNYQWIPAIKIKSFLFYI